MTTPDGKVMSEVRPEPRHPVRSTPIPTRSSKQNITSGLTLLVFGLLFWLPAARTTVDGWPILLNIVLDYFHVPYTVPRADGWLLLGLAIAVGFVYSRVEFSLPIRMRNGRLWVATPALFLAWLLLATTDVGTTFLGVSTPPPGAWFVHQQLAANPPLAGIVALIATFAPDWMLRIGWRYFRG